MGGLQELRTLDLFENWFRILPKVTYQLEKLETLILSKNKKLEKIDDEILQLKNLEILECDQCSSLEYPPYAVCQQEFNDIKEYLLDIVSGKRNWAT